MDQFNEDHAKLLLSKEWLVKVDAQTSTPYLIKFHSSTVDLTCCILITDTSRTWAEVLSSKQFARRWRQCNHDDKSSSLDEDDEESWRTRHLDLLSKAHTLGGMTELSFDVVESNFGDLAFEFECNAFKWRWETIFVGHKTSADILSKHLIMPLISVNHLAFSSSDPVSNLPPSDLEKAIDKVARTARRTVDTHVKNALSKPRLATTIRRITAIFNFISEPPSIITEVESPILSLPSRAPTPKIKPSPEYHTTTRSVTPEPKDSRDHHGPVAVSSTHTRPLLSRGQSPHNQGVADSGSATEPEDDDVRMGSPTSSKIPIPLSSPLPRPGSARNRNVTKSSARSPSPSSSVGPGVPPKGVPSEDTDSSPVRPVKKPKPKPRVSSEEDEDSEEERKKMATQIRSGSAPTRGGLRQPIKRGGKRF